jgi:hypothetical protein
MWVDDRPICTFKMLDRVTKRSRLMKKEVKRSEVVSTMTKRRVRTRRGGNKRASVFV